MSGRDVDRRDRALGVGLQLELGGSEENLTFFIGHSDFLYRGRRRRPLRGKLVRFD